MPLSLVPSLDDSTNSMVSLDQLQPEFLPHPSTVSSTASFREPTLDELRALQREAGYPLVSVLMSTAPDMLIGVDHVFGIERLVDEAGKRLRLEVPGPEADQLVEAMCNAARRLIGQRTAHGVAVFASSRGCKVYRIGSRVDDRIVVDPTFATRDLARSLALNPTYRLLVLTQGSARLLVGSGSQLVEVKDGKFPITTRANTNGKINQLVTSRGAEDRGNRSTIAAKQRKGLHDDSAFVRRVSMALGAHVPSAQLPLVAIVSTALASTFKSQTAIHSVGMLIGSHERTSASRLANLVRPAIEAHLADERESALTRLDQAISARQAAVGINHVWTAAQRGVIDTLVVDESFRFPAWTTLGGKSLVRAFTPEQPDVIDDAVDEIIEMVQRLNSAVCFVPAGELGTDKIAAVLKRQAG